MKKGVSTPVRPVAGLARRAVSARLAEMLAMPSLIREQMDGVCLAVKLQPRAAKNEIGTALGDELKVKVTAPPVEAAAAGGDAGLSARRGATGVRPDFAAQDDSDPRPDGAAGGGEIVGDVAVEVTRLQLKSGKGSRSEPPHVGCYGDDDECIFGKNFAAVVQVAALSSSSVQALVCATTSEISFT